ncbi:hypothetical protein [Streptomyces sp. NPDC058623]|uniref:hypothetical protein n=1 Tax=Streptomyces sp. NPDC058623 TaxID=3346563 RepID=UPI00364FC680
MIAGTPVARWSWGEPGRETDPVREAVRRFLVALSVLNRHRLGTPHGGVVAVEVPEMGCRSILLRADLPFRTAVSEPGPPVAEALTKQIADRLAPGEVGSVNLYAACDGIVETGTGGAEAVEGLFELTAAVSEGCFNVGQPLRGRRFRVRRVGKLRDPLPQPRLPADSGVQGGVRAAGVRAREVRPGCGST